MSGADEKKHIENKTLQLRALLVAAITSSVVWIGCGGADEPSPTRCEKAGKQTCPAGESDACTTDEASSQTCIPAPTPSNISTHCNAIKQAVEVELAAVAQCSSDAQCKYAFLGSGCTDGALPLCGFAHADGASLSLLEALDQQYRDSSCGGDQVACADCASWPGMPASCVSGVCTAQP
jgi:hypothetical protein